MICHFQSGAEHTTLGVILILRLNANTRSIPLKNFLEILKSKLSNDEKYHKNNFKTGSYQLKLSHLKVAFGNNFINPSDKYHKGALFGHATSKIRF